MFAKLVVSAASGDTLFSEEAEKEPPPLAVRSLGLTQIALVPLAAEMLNLPNTERRSRVEV